MVQVTEEEAVAVLQELKSRTPDYMGNGPKPQHYQRIHAAYDVAITALTQAQAETAAKDARLKASMEMAEDYHAAHIEQRDRANNAEADNAALRERVAVLTAQVEADRDTFRNLDIINDPIGAACQLEAALRNCEAALGDQP